MRGLSVVRAVVVAAAAGGVVFGSAEVDVDADWSRGSDNRAAQNASAALNTTLVCPGPDRPGTPGYEDAKQTVDLATGGAPASVLKPHGEGAVRAARLPSGAGAAPPTRTAPVQVARDRVSGAGGVHLDGSGSAATGLAALQSWDDEEQSVGGFAMAPCGVLTKDTWFPLGGNQSGRVGRVVISNPSSAPVTVDAEVLGRGGVDAGQGAKGLVVAPGDRAVVGVGDFGDDLSDAFVHVVARGGAVAVSGVDAWMTGETRSGQAGSAPAAAGTDLVLPQVPVVAGTPTVRVAVPGALGTSVRVRAIDSAGLVVADEVTDVDAKSTVAVPLTDVPKGSYAVRVTSEQPVAAAVLAMANTSGTSDIGWATPVRSSGALIGSPLPKLPEGAGATLGLFSADRPATVDVVTDDGAPRRVHLEKDRPLRLDVRGRDSVWVRVLAGSVRGSVVVSGQIEDRPVLEVSPLEPVAVEATVRESTAERD